MADLSAVETTDDPEIAQEIERELLASLARINRQTETLRTTFCQRGPDGRLMAGLTCSIAYGWLHIETLWVREDFRAAGHGRGLMNAAEDFGRAHGCHAAWLDTSNAGAQAFYQRLGYYVFGKLANGEGRLPAEHRRWFLQRLL